MTVFWIVTACTVFVGLCLLFILALCKAAAVGDRVVVADEPDRERDRWVA